MDTTSISSLLNSLQATPLMELILLYFLGFLLSSVIRNILSLDTSNDIKGFKFSKKFASGMVVVSLALSISHTASAFSSSKPFELVVITIFVLFVAVLLIALIFQSKYFQKAYYYLYVLLFLTAAMGINKNKIGEVFKRIKIWEKNFNHHITFSHLIYHLPSFLISIIVAMYTHEFGFLVNILVYFLLIVYLYSEYVVELKRRSPDKTGWMDNGSGFGYLMSEYIRTLG